MLEKHGHDFTLYMIELGLAKKRTIRMHTRNLVTFHLGFHQGRDKDAGLHGNIRFVKLFEAIKISYRDNNAWASLFYGV